MTGIFHIRVTREICGTWHGDTWYRVGQEFHCVPTEPPSRAGWRPLVNTHSGSIDADHAEVLGPSSLPLRHTNSLTPSECVLHCALIQIIGITQQTHAGALRSYTALSQISVIASDAVKASSSLPSISDEDFAAWAEWAAGLAPAPTSVPTADGSTGLALRCSSTAEGDPWLK